jgi:2,3-bisphosphoglycerate-independent phosphoglycerate mutase
MQSKRRALLIILDGWGLRQDPFGNAITEAQPEFYQKLLQNHPWVAIEASGPAVGLPPGQMGNSEVGHLNLGAGRVIYQDLTKIDKAIADNELQHNPVLLAAMQQAKHSETGTLHMMGLLSDGGVHSHIEHVLALLKMAKQQDVKTVRVHGFLDGRDVSPQSALSFIDTVEALLLDLDYPQIATLSGRYFAMDRDNRWERIEQAYQNLVTASGPRSLNATDAVKKSYHNQVTDEFVLPCVCDVEYTGMAPDEAVIFFNFRPDRARELTRALTMANFSEFERPWLLPSSHMVCLSTYDETFTLPVAYPKDYPTDLLGQIVSEAGLKQFRCAETEKYAHVTYFFNGGQEPPYPGEDRVVVASPKVATYDLQPEMSLPQVEKEVLSALATQEYSLIVTNFANPDMIGHTGLMPAAIQAVKAVDSTLEVVITEALAQDYAIFLTADHGNIEKMIDEDGGPHTAHTTDLVPLVLISRDKTLGLLKRDTPYALGNVAPSILAYLELSIPSAMTCGILNHATELV